jgi:hypothetical protein
MIMSLQHRLWSLKPLLILEKCSGYYNHLTTTKINFIRPNAFDSTGEEFRWSDIMKVVFFFFFLLTQQRKID